MTLVSARDKAIDAIKNKVKNMRPIIKVSPYDGTFSIEEVKRLYTSTPTILVSPLSTGKDGVKLAVYLLTKSTDKGLLEVVDLVINTLRHLPGAGRPVLDVAAISLYDKEAGKIGARLWGFTVIWPHLSIGAVSETHGGPIYEEVENIKSKIKNIHPQIKIGGTEAERSVMKAESNPPFVLLTPKSGTFNTSRSGAVKYSDPSKTLWERKISGSIKIPIEIECWGRDEAEAENLAFSFLSILSYSASVLGINKKVFISGASPIENSSGACIFLINLTYEAQTGTAPIKVPVLKDISISSDD